MKGKKEIIGIIPREKIFQATKERFIPAGRCGPHGAETPPRERKMKPWEYDPEDYKEE